jgi:signal transduction histidine kinase
VEVHIRRIDLDGEDRFIVISRDISERNRRERELERQNERLEEFASIVSHDLRNPLTVAEARLELAQDECDSEHLEDVDRAHDRMNALIDDLLTLARETVDLGSLATDCWGNVVTEGSELELNTDARVRADPSRLQQLLENLMRNAVEHGSTSPRSQAPEGAVEHGGPSITVTVGTQEGGFYVEDDGEGIPREEREEVFEAGYSTDRDGTGFGLTIVQQVAEAHGWTVRATEGREGGARFEITGVEFAAD